MNWLYIQGAVLLSFSAILQEHCSAFVYELADTDREAADCDFLLCIPFMFSFYHLIIHQSPVLLSLNIFPFFSFLVYYVLLPNLTDNTIVKRYPVAKFSDSCHN